MDNFKIGKNLKVLMAKHKLTAMELARKTGVGQPVIYRIMTDETDNPKIATLYTLAKYFGVTIDQLIGVDELFLSAQSVKKQTAIPIITWNEAINWFSKPKTTRTLLLDGTGKYKGNYALEVQDNSMEPLFTLNSLLVIDGERSPLDGDFAIVKIENEEDAILRQVLYDGTIQYLKPLSQNSDKYKIKMFSKKDKYCGVVTQCRRNFI